ncbi:MAG: hypothetical protein AB7E79_06050 [Rhodospirillaceae bacterium]
MDLIETGQAKRQKRRDIRRYAGKLAATDEAGRRVVLYLHGKDRAVLRYKLGEQVFEKECLYEGGIALSTRMTINPYGSVACESGMRI